MYVDPTPYKAAHLPFANEDEVQRFLVKHTRQILGVSVITTSLRGGGRLCDIDILGVDDAGTPVIIECKWDRVDAAAIGQLTAYAQALKNQWESFERRVSKLRRPAVSIKHRDPILIAVGYRYDPSVLATTASVNCLAYRYDGAAPLGGVVERRRPGRVSIQWAHQTGMPHPHPRVLKKDGTDERLKRRLPELRTSFWDLDGRLRALEDVTAVYFKNVAHYRVSRGQFAEAKINSLVIQWRFARPGSWRDSTKVGSVEMLAPSDAETVFRQLQRTHRDAG